MKVLSFLFLILTLASCNPAETQKVEEAAKIVEASNKYAYDCHCAQAICEKKLDIKGSNEITFEKDNVIYCFSTVEAKNKFIQEIGININKANANWLERISNKGI